MKTRDQDNQASRSSKAVSVRLSDAALKQILAKMDAAEKPDVANRRQHERYVYRRSLLVELTQPSGNIIVLKAPTRDISASGLSFLHHGFVHRGSKCHIQLVTIRNSWVEVDGVVNRCDYIEDGIHLISVKFSQQVDIISFAASALPRRVLVVDDDPQLCKLVSFHLKKMNAEVSVAHNGEEVLAAIQKATFDLILMDVEMPVLDGVETIKRMRAAGYGGCVAAMTALSAPGDRERLLEAGFSRYLPKPIAPEQLADVLEQLDDEPLFSTMSEVEGMVELIDGFVDELAARITALEKAVSAKEIPELAKLARTLKGEAGSYGFEPISQAAQDVETLAQEAGDAARLEKPVRELTKLCRLARKASV